MNLIGLEFDYAHGGGTARYQVRRHHRDAGYFECVVVKAIGSHQFLGSIDIWSRSLIQQAVAHPSCSCGTLTGRHDATCFPLPAGVRAEWEAEDVALAWAAEGEDARHPRERW